MFDISQLRVPELKQRIHALGLTVPVAAVEKGDLIKILRASGKLINGDTLGVKADLGTTSLADAMPGLPRAAYTASEKKPFTSMPTLSTSSGIAYSGEASKIGDESFLNDVVLSADAILHRNDVSSECAELFENPILPVRVPPANLSNLDERPMRVMEEKRPKKHELSPSRSTADGENKVASQGVQPCGFKFARKETLPVQPSVPTNTKCKRLPASQLGAQSLAARLNTLRAKDKFCDIILAAGGKRFTAHQAVLAAASTCLSEFLATQAEKNEGCTRGPEFEPPQALELGLEGVTHPEAVEAMLCHVYGAETVLGTWPTTPEANADVLRLAIGFQLPHLQERAERWLEEASGTASVPGCLAVCNEFGLTWVRARILHKQVLKEAAALITDNSPKTRLRGKRPRPN